MKIAVLTSEGGLYRIKEIPDLSGVLVFSRSSGTKLPVPSVWIHERGLKSFLNEPFGLEEFKDRELELFAYDRVEWSLHLCKKVSTCLMPQSAELMFGLMETGRTLFMSFCGLLLLILNTRLRFRVSPCKELRLFGQRRCLWEVMFLPCVAPAVAKEIDASILYRIELQRKPRECINTVMSYLMSSAPFNAVLKRCILKLQRLGIAEPHLTKTHGGLSSYTRKLSEPTKGIEPPQDLFSTLQAQE